MRHKKSRVQTPDIAIALWRRPTAAPLLVNIATLLELLFAEPFGSCERHEELKNPN